MADGFAFCLTVGRVRVACRHGSQLEPKSDFICRKPIRPDHAKYLVAGTLRNTDDSQSFAQSSELKTEGTNVPWMWPWMWHQIKPLLRIVRLLVTLAKPSSCIRPPTPSPKPGWFHEKVLWQPEAV